jgi:hypothetical protein
MKTPKLTLPTEKDFSAAHKRGGLTEVRKLAAQYDAIAKTMPQPTRGCDPHIWEAIQRNGGWWFGERDVGIPWDEGLRRVALGKDWWGHDSLGDFMRSSLRNIFGR